MTQVSVEEEKKKKGFNYKCQAQMCNWYYSVGRDSFQMNDGDNKQKS